LGCGIALLPGLATYWQRPGCERLKHGVELSAGASKSSRSHGFRAGISECASLRQVHSLRIPLGLSRSPRSPRLSGSKKTRRKKMISETCGRLRLGTTAYPISPMTAGFCPARRRDTNHADGLNGTRVHVGNKCRRKKKYFGLATTCQATMNRARSFTNWIHESAGTNERFPCIRPFPFSRAAQA